MTENAPEVKQEQTQNDKEYNFRMQQAKYERELAKERADKEELARQVAQLSSRNKPDEDDDDDSEPYVDKRKLNKTLQKFGAQTQQTTQTEIKKAVNEAIYEERKNNWIKNNPDFYETLNNHAQKFALKDPELAETILSMPDGFERQKLVYKNIKALGIDKPEEKRPSIQDTIDANRRSPYYQPSGVGTSPYANAGDFSKAGQQNAYNKMQELKKRLGV
jgi:hypothetical protein